MSTPRRRRADTRGEKVIKFIEKYCVVPEGEHVGNAMVLEPFQKRFIRDVYDNPKQTRRAYLSIGRKNGKTGLTAAIMLAHLVGPETRKNSQIISGAQSRDQAALVYNLASKMVMLHPDLRSIIKIVPSSKRLVGLPQNVEYHAISAEGKTAYGLSPSLALLDEVGQVRGPQDEFIDAIVTSQGAHAAPLLIAISTQAPNDTDMFSMWLDDAKVSKDTRIVSHVYEAPIECGLGDKAAWSAANPALGKFRSLEDVEEQAERALRMPSFEPTFRNLVLNQRVEIFSPFVSKSVWSLNSLEPDPAAFYEAPVYVGLDLSGKADLTAAVVIAKKEGRWHVRSYFWTPEKGLRERARQSRTPLELWVKQGHIKAVPGAAIDYEYIARDLAELLDGCMVKGIAFDRWRFDLLKKELDEIGSPLVSLMLPFGQGFKDMTPALETLESALLNDEMAHGEHPVLTMCMMNSRVETDPAGNRKLSKFKAVGRIDGAVALAMAMGASNMLQEKPLPFQAYFL